MRMSGSGVGRCGGLPLSLPHDPAGLHGGWMDGDLNYKPSGNWLALFYDDEENSERYGGWVAVGHVRGPVEALRELEGADGGFGAAAR